MTWNYGESFSKQLGDENKQVRVSKPLFNHFAYPQNLEQIFR